MLTKNRNLQKIISLLLAVVMLIGVSQVTLFSGIEAEAEEIDNVLTEDNFNYIVTDGFAKITGYVGSEDEIIVPASIGGYKVTTIGHRSFAENSDIRSVTVSSGIQEIELYAFVGCTKLEKVVLPNSVTGGIGTGVFADCISLKDVTLPSNFEYIPISMFSGCTSLEFIAIPETVFGVDWYAFGGCSSLSAICFSKKLLYIGMNAFKDCSNLKNIYFEGTKSDWENIEIENYNDNLNSITINYNEPLCPDGHIYNSIVESEPTCTEMGSKLYTCKKCGDAYSENISAKGHQYKSVITKEATCTETGLKTFTCESCKDIYTEKIFAKGHVPGGWIISKEPTVTTKGEKYKKCAVCKEIVEKEDIPELNAKDFISVSVDNFAMNYKSTMALNAKFGKLDGVDYTIKYESSDNNIVSVDENGNVTATGTGEAEITVTVTDEYGNIVKDTCKVTVSYSWWQWLIVIFLFGWIWY